MVRAPFTEVVFGYAVIPDDQIELTGFSASRVRVNDADVLDDLAGNSAFFFVTVGALTVVRAVVGVVIGG